MADSKIFKLDEGMTAESIGIGVESFFREKKNMVIEGIKTPEGYLIQAKEEQSWKKFAGMDNATQVQLFQSTEDTITVNVGTGKWIDKAAAAGVGAIVFAPLLATAAFGAFKQQKLPQEVFEYIEQYIQTGGKSVTVSMGGSLAASQANKISCPTCHAQNEKGTKFCSFCGTKLVETCENCHEEVAMGTKFCPDCGENLEKSNEKRCQSCDALLTEETKFCQECGTKVD